MKTESTHASRRYETDRHCIGRDGLISSSFCQILCATPNSPPESAPVAARLRRAGKGTEPGDTRTSSAAVRHRRTPCAPPAPGCAPARPLALPPARALQPPAEVTRMDALSYTARLHVWWWPGVVLCTVAWSRHWWRSRLVWSCRYSADDCASRREVPGTIILVMKLAFPGLSREESWSRGSDEEIR
jgi:hypothetical protein